MGFGKLLEQKIKEKGYNKSKFAAAIGVSKTTLSSMISRDVSKIEIELFLKICSVLDCNPEEFYNEYKNEYKKIRQASMPPSFARKYSELDKYGKKTVNAVLECEYSRCAVPAAAEEDEAPTLRMKRSVYKVSAGHGFFLDGSDSWDYIDVPDTPAARQADFALTISGDSMEPIYHDGDIVLVKEQPELRIGEVGIFVMDGGIGYIKKNGGDRLISLNERYDDIMLSEDNNAKIVGKVIGRV